MQTENNPIRERNISELFMESTMKDAFWMNVWKIKSRVNLFEFKKKKSKWTREELIMKFW